MTLEAKWSDFASLDGARTLAAANKLLPAWISLLLVILIAWQLARIVWTFVPGPSAGDPVALPAGQSSVDRSAGAAVDVQAIAGAHIFGKAESDDAPIQPVIADDSENLDDTQIASLSLKGTIASEEPELSAAIIADSGNEEKVYVIGDPITSRATLHAVYTDRVVLNENGRLTNLRLPDEFAAAARPTVRRTTAPARTTTNTRQSIQSVVSNNVARLADVIRPTPYFVNGQQQGYRVYPGRDRQQFAALGLRPGDLIKDIDGQSLTDPTQAMQIFQSLGSANQVSVTVERNGQPETIVLKTSQLEIGEKQSR